MTLLVRSARVGRYHGADALNVTRLTGCSVGRVFAPSWDILAPELRRRRAARQLAALDTTAVLEAIEAEGITVESARERAAFAWAAYTERYLAEMRVSYTKWRPAWDALLARQTVVLLCYCGGPHGAGTASHCHRAILRAKVLPQLGATDLGEVTDE